MTSYQQYSLQAFALIQDLFTMKCSLQRKISLRAIALAAILLIMIGTVTAQSIIGSSTACGGATANYSIAASGASWYSWTVTGGVIQGSDANSSVTVLWDAAGGTGTVSVSYDNGSRSKSVTVSSLYRGGAISGPSIQCPGTSITLTVSGGTGTILRWERSINNGSSWTSISNTSSSYTVSGLTQTTLFRVAKNDATCGTIYSTNKTVTAPAAFTAPGSIGGAQTICPNQTPVAFTSTAVASGGSGSYAYQWEFRDPSGTWTSITGATAVTYQAPALTQTREYRRTVSDGCTALSSNVIVVTINQHIYSLSVSDNDNGGYCVGGSGVSFTLSGSDVGVSYGLKRDGSNVQTIAGTGAALVWNNITNEGNYTVIATQGSCTFAMTGNFDVHRYPAFSTPTIKGPTATCYDTAPGDYGNVNGDLGAGVGGTGNYSVQWEERIPGGTWQPISGANNDYYSPGPRTQTVEFRRAATDAVCGTQYSNTITLQVDAISVGGMVSGAQTFFSGGSGIVTLSGYAGTIQEWQQSADGGITWSSIRKTAATLAYNATQTTTYRVKIKNGVCPAVYSASTTITIYPAPQIMLTGPATLSTAETSTLTLVSVYESQQWQKDGVDIPGATGNALTITTPGKYQVRVEQNGLTGFSDPVYIGNRWEEVLPNMNTAFAINYQRAGITAQTALVELQAEDYLMSRAFYDGLGRTVQLVQHRSTPAQKDIVQPVGYDWLGRQAVQYLPYASTTGTGGYRDNALNANNYQQSEQYLFYQGSTDHATDTKPYGQVKFEPSPFSTVKEQSGIGEGYQLGEHTTLLNARTNTVADGVYRWQLDATNMPVTPGNYAAGELVVSEVTDPTGLTARVFNERSGKTVLKRTLGNDGITIHETYYVYDAFNRPVVVLPPESVSRLQAEYLNATTADRQTFLNRWAYQYTYDKRHRVVEKRVPGAAPIYMVYDARDRLVMTQDGVQRGKSPREWSFMKYDALNRPVITGVLKDAYGWTRTFAQDYINDFYNGIPGNGHAWYEERGTTIQGYTSRSYPDFITEQECQTITYYDDYSFKQTLHHPDDYAFVSNDLAGQQASWQERAQGQVTGTRIKVLDGEAYGEFVWLTNVSYYDEKLRVIQVIADNSKGGIDRATSFYDFAGKVLQTKATHRVGDIAWKNFVQAGVRGNKVVKTSGAAQGWDSGAASAQVLNAGENGWMEVIASEDWSFRAVGLAAQNPNANFAAIDYGMVMRPDNNLVIVEQGVVKVDNAVYHPGDILRVVRTGTQVTYEVNGSVVYTSQAASTASLMACAVLYSLNGTVANARASFGGEVHVVTRRFGYDHVGRLVKTWHRIDDQAEVLLATSEYNELGQLITRKLHATEAITADSLIGQPGVTSGEQIVSNQYNGETAYVASETISLQAGFQATTSASSSFAGRIGYSQQQVDLINDPLVSYAQSVDYRYNIRGAVTRINNSDLSADNASDPADYFGLSLLYDEQDAALNNTPLYDQNVSAVKWSVYAGAGTPPAGAVKEQAYKFTYDPMKRLKTATPFEKHTTWATAAGGHENNLAYDRNGNILTLNRTGRDGGDLDKLMYAYSGNQLLHVDDQGDAANGFVDGNTTGDDYQYDANGNQVIDRNKHIAAVTYNPLNKPTKVTQDNGDYLLYVYAAGGVKLSEQSYSAAGEMRKKTDYSNGYLYENDTLRMIQHEQGRIIPHQDGTMEYQYHLTDHLGNVRLTFTTLQQTEEALATLETSSATTESGEFLYYDEAVLVNSTLFDHTNEGTTHYATRLNGSANERTGLARSVQVMPGDTIRMEVYAKYLDSNTNNWTTALANFMSAIASGTAPAGTVIDGGAAGSTGGTAPPYADLLDKSGEGGTAPKAYLNYLVFDQSRDSLLDGGYVRVTDAAREYGNDGVHERLAHELVITQPGYVYIYLSNENETAVDVFFDDLTVAQVKSPIVQEDNYYPFGMTLDHAQREAHYQNNFLFNGASEKNAVTGLYETAFRGYDASLGRFTGIDALAENYAGWTPYQFGYNNPVIFNDPMGLLVQKPERMDNEGPGGSVRSGGGLPKPGRPGYTWDYYLRSPEENARLMTTKQFNEFYGIKTDEDREKMAEAMSHTPTKEQLANIFASPVFVSLFGKVAISEIVDNEAYVTVLLEPALYNQNGQELRIQTNGVKIIELGPAGPGGPGQSGGCPPGIDCDQNNLQVQQAGIGGEDLIGPGLIAVGARINALKPVGALGSRPGSSIASATLSKALPVKMPFRVAGTTNLGRMLGRTLPFTGAGVVWTAFSIEDFFRDISSTFDMIIGMRDFKMGIRHSPDTSTKPK